MKTYLGLDTATNCGAVVTDMRGDVLYADVIKYPDNPREHRFARWHRYGSAVKELIRAHDVGFVAVEGYGFARTQNLVPVVEIGTLIREALHMTGVCWIEVPPTRLKKFATGKGNSNKAEMILSVYKRWGFETPNDNIADAFALSKLCAAVYGHVPDLGAKSLEVINDIKGA